MICFLFIFQKIHAMSNGKSIIRQQLKALKDENKNLRDANELLREENDQLHMRLSAIEDVLYRQSQRSLGRSVPSIDDPAQTNLFDDTDKDAVTNCDEEHESKP